jgi:glycerol-3-phosphate cytidylyltransferase
VPQEDKDKLKAWTKYKFDVMFVGSDWQGTDKWRIIEQQMNERDVDVIYFPYTKRTSSTLINQVLLRLRANEWNGLFGFFWKCIVI